MGLNACRKDADWFVEATVKKFTEGGFRPACDTITFQMTGGCPEAPQSPVLTLDHVTMVRGSLAPLMGKIEIRRQASCFGPPLALSDTDPRYLLYLDRFAVNHRFRFYGNHPRYRWPNLEGGFLFTEPLPSAR